MERMPSPVSVGAERSRRHPDDELPLSVGGLTALAGAGLALALLARWHLLFFHTIVELFSVLVAGTIAVVAWHVGPQMRSGFLAACGATFAAVGALDLLHAVTFEGSGLAPLADADTTLQFWLAARGIEALGLAGAVWLAMRRRDPPLLPLAAAVLGVAGVSSFVILAIDVLPAAYVPGQGLTAYKVSVEGVVIAVKAASLIALLVWRPLPAAVNVMAALYLVFTGAAELAFTLYDTLADRVLVAGHLLKVAGFYFLFQGLSATALRTPYRVLYRDLEAARDDLEARVEERTSALLDANAALREEVEARLRTERALDSARAALEAVLASTPLAVIALDAQRRVTVWNPAAEAIFGWSRDEVLGQPLPTAPPELRAEQRRQVDGVFAGGTMRGETITRHRKNGSPIEVRAFVAPVRDGDGAVCGLVSLLADITAEVRARRRVQEYQTRLAAIMDNLGDGILTVDAAGRVESANPAAGTLCGVPSGSLTGRRIDTLVQVSLAADDAGPAGRASPAPAWLVGGASGPFDGVVATSQAPAVPVDVTISRMPLGDEIHYIVVLRDTRERLRAQEAFAAIQLELAQAQKLEVLGSRMGDIAHEVNNMLMPILGLSELSLSDLPPDSGTRRNLETVVEAAVRARDVMRRILDFTRSDAPGAYVLDLGTALQDCERLLRVTVPSSVRLGVQVFEESLAVRADPTQLHQILLNLTSNAVQAMGSTGFIDVFADRRYLTDAAAATTRPPVRAGWYGVVVVRDTGPGMDEETRAHAFERYFTTKRAGEGSGMGLAVVEDIVAAWKGGIALETAPGEGATFTIHLPLLDQTLGDVTGVGKAPVPEVVDAQVV